MIVLSDEKRYFITITGIVQGVGFRPFVFRTAKAYKLNGWVENQGSRVIIDVEGKHESIMKFVHILQNEYPENAAIADFDVCQKPFFGYSDFSISQSSVENDTANFIPPDIAVCDRCIEEFNTLGAKRFRYPFISCTDCGPRYSIINSLPYDRKNTAMSKFEMCRECSNEYTSPSNHRFHAQTDCCPECGPVLKLLDAQGNTVDTIDPANLAGQLICQGKIIAVKGIGGYHLCCNAEDDAAVKRLRKLKKREHKPLAIMARNIETVNKVCDISEKEKDILLGRRKPILLLNKKTPEYLPEDIAPKQKRLGVMLPYAPLHFLLFQDGIDYIVMTSGNISGSPICYKDSDALKYLNNVAEYFLTHDREITVSVDDAVVKVADGNEVLIRCGRGYAPLTIPINNDYKILALGAEQKCSVCFAENGFAAVSQYIGNLNEYKTYRAFERQIEHFKNLFHSSPEIYAHDMNTDYLSSRYAIQNSGTDIKIQHHHAHMAGCMAENNLTRDVIGIVYDGTGLGTDGAIWGGEIFIGSLSDFKRVGHLKYVTLQGGDSAVKEPWRCAEAYLVDLGIIPQCFLTAVDADKLSAVSNALKSNIKCYKSSSMGRLFDCVSALCGFQTPITYDAQAAIELESLIDEETDDFYSFNISDSDNILIIEYDGILNGVLTDIFNHVPKSLISAKFHNTVIEATSDSVCRIRKMTGLEEVVLSGGVFENTYLLEHLVKKFRNLDFDVYYNRLTPTNDGGISFGQAAAAGAILKENDYVSCSSC